MLKWLLKYCNAYGPVIIWAVVIFIFSSQSSLPGFDVLFYDYLFKKISHMTVYGIFYLLLFRAMNMDPHHPQKNWKGPFLWTLIYAIADEFHQIFTPYRHPNMLDVGYDMLGASIVFLRLYRYI